MTGLYNLIWSLIDTFNSLYAEKKKNPVGTRRNNNVIITTNDIVIASFARWLITYITVSLKCVH